MLLFPNSSSLLFLIILLCVLLFGRQLLVSEEQYCKTNIKKPDELTGQTAKQMTTKELCFYVSVETVLNGNTRYLLRTNQSNWIYEFPWGDEILEENDPGYQAFYTFFEEKIRDVLFATKINDADFVTYKVFYNNEEKTTGKLTKQVGEDKGIFYRNSEIRDEIPVSYNRILFLRKLFRKMMS